MLFNEKVLDLALSQIGLKVGWQSMSQQSMRILQSLIIKYIQEIGKSTMGYANNFNRCEAMLSDAMLALQQMNMNYEELQEYMRTFESEPFVKANVIPRYPCPPVRGYYRINFPTPDEIASRPEHIEEWLPSLNFGDKPSDNKGTDSDAKMADLNGVDITENSQANLNELNNGADSNSVCNGGKKEGFRPENDHIYLSSVYIDAEGRVVGIGGREGVAPDSKLPPRDDYEERRLAEEEAKRRKREDEESERLKKKQKADEDTNKIKLKIKDSKASIRGKKEVIGKKRNSLAEKKVATKKKSSQILSIKFSGLRSDSPTARPSPSLPLSPSFSKDDQASRLTFEEERNLDNCINAVVERSRKGDESKDSGLEANIDEDYLKSTKVKRIKKGGKTKEKPGVDETIESVIKTAMDNGESSKYDDFDQSSVFQYDDLNNFGISSRDEVTGVDAKEAAKILVSLSTSDESSKKSKKSNSRKIPRTPSPPSPASFSNYSSLSSQAFSKVPTPLSPNANLSTFGQQSSHAKSPTFIPTPISHLQTKPLVFKDESISETLPFNRTSSPLPPAPSIPPFTSESNSDYKPPFKTLAAKKVLPPIDEELLLKKEKKEKKKKDKLKDKIKDKDKADRLKDRSQDVSTKKFDNKEGRKEKKAKRSSDGSRNSDSFASEMSPKQTPLKVNTRRSSSADIPSPSSSTSSTKLVIKTPATSSLASGKDLKKSLKKKQRMNSNSVSNDSIKPSKLNVKDRVKDRPRGKDEKRNKDRGDKGDASCVLITETVSKAEKGREKEEKEWICPLCSKPYDMSSNMIGCDGCDDWYHWACVGIKEDPPEEESWFCIRCIERQKSIENKVKKKSSSVSTSSKVEIDTSSNQKGKFLTGSCISELSALVIFGLVHVS